MADRMLYYDLVCMHQVKRINIMAALEKGPENATGPSFARTEIGWLF